MTTDSTINRRTLLAYGALSVPITLAELPLVIYLPAFYAKEVGVSLGLIGLAFTLARIWDGVSDVLIGRLSDRFRPSVFGRRLWVLSGIPFFLLATWFLFNPPAQVGLWYLALWLPVFYTAHTAVKIPYWSWGGELATGYEERNRVASFREGGQLVAMMVFGLAPLLLLQEGASIQTVLYLFALIVIVLTAVSVVPLALRRVPDNAALIRESSSIREDIRAIARNTPKLLFLGSVLFASTGLGVISSCFIFLVEIGLALPGKVFALVFIQQCVGIFLIPVIMVLASRIGKHTVYRWSIGLLSIFLGVLCVYLPAGQYMLTMAAWGIIGVFYTGVLMTPISMVSDIVDYDSAKTGQYRPGMYFASFNLVLKLGTALGVGIGFGLLAVLGFDPTDTVHSSEAITHLRIVGFGVSALLMLPAFIFLKWYPITKQYHQQLRRDIEARASDEKPENDDATKAAAVVAG